MSHLIKKFVLAIIFLPYFDVAISQVANPSFEGSPGTSKNPPGWSSCNEYATPDIQPGGWNVITEPSHGKTYISLVARGNDGSSNSDFTEDISTYVEGFLLLNECYELKLDLAYSSTFYDGIRFLNNPLIIKIWGGNANCEKLELLGKSSKVNHPNWITYTFNLIPRLNTYSNLYIEAFYHQFPTYYGNVLVDNLGLSKVQVDDNQYVMDTMVNEGAMLQLNAGDENASYDWNPKVGLSCYNCSAPILEVNGSISYTVTISTNAGCLQKKIFLVKTILKIPNIFTPNKDLINDRFRIKGLPPQSQLVIYNRWGSKVFSTGNYKNDWNGVYLGEDLTDGVYYFILLNEEFGIKEKGFFTIKS